MRIIGLTGDEAVAYAVKQCDVDVVAAYPITPQTIIVERISDFVANGEINTEYVCVESEHSALSACIGASVMGARVFTATSSQGLALMHEILYIASSLRLPIVMAVVNRALSAPINIHGDHSDMMGSRDCGWIQIYAENAQEAYDTTIQAFKIAESPNVSLPVSVNLDGFIISHSMERVEILDDEDVKIFLPPRKPLYRLDVENPITIGPLCFTDYYFEFKKQQAEAMEKSYKTIMDVMNEYSRVTGRSYKFIDTYGIEDSEILIVCMGSTCGTARYTARKLREKGEKVGVIKVSLYRPFPSEELIEAIKNAEALIVMDRAVSFGASSGPLCSDVKNTLYDAGFKIKILNIIYGLGGRDVSQKDIEQAFRLGFKLKSGDIKDRVLWLGVRE
jgi:pyruvate ferredoxin oxidoreductase alpha subunit